MALGYSEGHKIPYKRAVLKYTPTWPRSFTPGSQTRRDDNGAKEVHVRISCPPLVYGCPFIGFTSSKSDLELITRRIIKEFEGDENKKLTEYATTDSPEYKRMVEEIGRRLGLTSLRFARLDSLIESIGLPKCDICTHCFDGTSYCKCHE